MSVLVELCAGTASISLWALGRCPPLCGFMGSKRRFAPVLVPALGCDRPERVVLVDAGPWGDVWSVLACESSRATVAGVLAGWANEPPADLWGLLVASDHLVSPEYRVARYLWLQSRAAGSLPIWRERGAWRWAASGSPAQKGPPTGARWGPGVQTAAQLAARVRRLGHLDWSRVDVVHGDCRTVAPIPGAVVLLDPPYVGCPRYAAELPRADVLALAQRYVAAGARVAVCEAVPLTGELGEGWHARKLSGRKPEWITTSWPVRLPEQLDLWRAA